MTKPRETFRPLAMLVVLLGLAALATAAPAAPAHRQAETLQLTGVDWRLVSYGSAGDLTDVPDEIEITARFDATEGTVTGRGGCNGFFGGFEAADDRLSVSNMGFTQMMCDPEVMKHEDAFIRMFSLTERYEVGDDSLTLHLSDGQVMAFRQQGS